LDGKRQTLEAPLPADLLEVCERLGPSL